MDSSKLNSNSFLNLLNGEPVEIEKTNLNVDWENLNINVVESKLIIKGLKGEIKTLYNTPDVNFKLINLIPHPLNNN